MEYQIPHNRWKVIFQAHFDSRECSLLVSNPEKKLTQNNSPLPNPFPEESLCLWPLDIQYENACILFPDCTNDALPFLLVLTVFLLIFMVQ